MFMLWAAYLPSWVGWLVKAGFILGAPAAGLISLALARIAIECVTVIFAINDKLGILVQESQKGTRS
jgi:hypothetical protein